MRLICLNIWGGKRYEPLMEYINANADTTDVFCFQELFDSRAVKTENIEIRIDLLKDMTKRLPDHDAAYAPMFYNNIIAKGTGEAVTMGPGIFSKHTLQTDGFHHEFLTGTLREQLFNDPHDTGFMISKTFTTDKGPFTVVNVHGIALWPKHDTPLRETQRTNLVAYLKTLSHPYILCGDFNLFPTTESIATLRKMLRDMGLEHGVETTRSESARKEFEWQPDRDTISDYLFISDGIVPVSFKVREVEVSDHLPLEFEFELA